MQNDMFGATRYPDGPAEGKTKTSRDAAEKIKPRAGSLREKIYNHLRGRGARGCTLEEIETQLLMAGNTVRPRMKELEARERVRKTDRTRRTRSGRDAIVWEVVT